MNVTSLEVVKRLQQNAHAIRNVCILAHVDHGKTTLADSLIASNGIISQRLAGKLRYMDSLEEEQTRGITMKSSAITLLHGSNLVNLIDSPGHVDFSGEVSTAARLCDGAIVIVDVVEGVCPQTSAVLRQAWLENIRPVLVLNKIDRLITELKLTPLEAYQHLHKLVEQVNAVTGSLFSAQVLEKATKKYQPTVAAQSEEANKSNQSSGEKQVYDWSSGLDEADDEDLYFSPLQGNVIFASAVDGWAFSIAQFAQLYAVKLSIREELLARTLWGDFFLNRKAKKISRGAHDKGKKPLFVQFVLDNIWSVYEAVNSRNTDRTDQITQSLGLHISVRDSRQSDQRAHLSAIFRQWLPLSEAVLRMVIQHLPSPAQVSSERVEKLLCGGAKRFESLPEQSRQLKQDLMNCSSSEDAPVIVFVSKMVAVSANDLPQNKQKPLEREELVARHEDAKKRVAERLERESNINQESERNVEQESEGSDVCEPTSANEEDKFIGFARVFSGTLRKHSKLYVLGPKYDPTEHLEDILNDASGDANPVEQTTEKTEEKDVVCVAESVDNTVFGRDLSGVHISVCQVEDLYLMMGREFEELDEVPAGNVLGIAGLDAHVLKSATLSSTRACPAFSPLLISATPIVRVAVEPRQPSQLASLVRGLKLLNQADPCVSVLVQRTGEYVVAAAGEVHLERCLEDLRKNYAKVAIKSSDPIIPFRETIAAAPKMDMVNEEMTDMNRASSHHSQRLPAFMMREIQQFHDTIYKGDDTSTPTPTCKGDGDENYIVEMTKSEISEEKKLKKMISKKGLIKAFTANKKCFLSLYARPLPHSVTDLLEKSVHLVKILQTLNSACTFEERILLCDGLSKEISSDLLQFHNSLKQAFEESSKFWQDAVHRIWSIGPKGMGTNLGVGTNLLLNKVDVYNRRPSIWFGLLPGDTTEDKFGEYREFDNSVANGFLLASQAGPMCEEPMMGVCFVVEKWENSESKAINCAETQSEETVESNTQNSAGTSIDINLADPPSELSPAPSSSTSFGLSGQLISAAKEGCRQAFMAQPMRIACAMYSCDIQVPADVLGRMYAVLGKREGRIISEEMREGSDIFNIVANLPVAESFGFAEEIRKRTSGFASPQLVFSHWEAVEVDPFWTPCTEGEYELYGEKWDTHNQALQYVVDVRKRKGLYVEEKTVAHAEKQRTLKKNK